MNNNHKDLQENGAQPIPIRCGSTSVINISIVMNYKIKHIPIKYNFLSEQVDNKSIILEYI